MILVTGGNGQLGSALKQVLKNEEAVFTDVETLDVTDEAAVLNKVLEVKPDYVFHCAALTNVDGCETNRELADRINHRSVEYFAKACEKVGAALFYISTDYVFDGKAEVPYPVNAETNPMSEYGKTKLSGEEAARNYPKHYIFRTSWVYGDGHNFVRTMLNLSEKMDELKVVSDQIGRPTYALDLAKAMKEAIDKKIPFGTYHFQNDGEPIAWSQFSEAIFEIAGKETKVIPISFDEYLEMNSGKEVAPRPNYSVLDLTSLKELGFQIRHWRDALVEYLQDK